MARFLVCTPYQYYTTDINGLTSLIQFLEQATPVDREFENGRMEHHPATPSQNVSFEVISDYPVYTPKYTGALATLQENTTSSAEGNQEYASAFGKMEPDPIVDDIPF